MKIRVDRNDFKRHTMVVFYLEDDEIEEAERESKKAGVKRPPSLGAYPTLSGLTARDCIHYIAWLAKIKLTF